MSSFQELIKKFDKIRDFSRDFLVYGIRTRNTQKIKSKRTYDNEKRRIESFLADYVVEKSHTSGKSINISINPEEMTMNPLFALWETKSFTRNDIFLHFVLMDILECSTRMSISHIYDEVIEYIDEDHQMMDMMTVRNKLNEYEKLGILSKYKEGKQYLYSLSKNRLESLTDKEKLELKQGVDFLSNILPFGVLGMFLSRNLGDSDMNFYQMKYKHYFMFHTLDDELLFDVLKLIETKQKGLIETWNKTNDKIIEKMCTPLMILTNVKHGRRYVVVYDHSSKNFYSLRLDKLKKVSGFEVDEEFKNYLEELKQLEVDSWGVYLNRTDSIEHICMTLKIHEDKEQYMIRRIIREGKHGILEKVDENIFEYHIDVIDTYEIIPWLRTFIGRIVGLNGTNEKAIGMFKKDVRWMYKMYEIGGECL
ncbi:MAG: WYL domain-containing protein [Clostridiales bacterium]|nr:WYL domain-containing protein [Clostridiales bacterium]